MSLGELLFFFAICLFIDTCRLFRLVVYLFYLFGCLLIEAGSLNITDCPGTHYVDLTTTFS